MEISYNFRADVLQVECERKYREIKNGKNDFSDIDSCWIDNKW